MAHTKPRRNHSAYRCEACGGRFHHGQTIDVGIKGSGRKRRIHKIAACIKIWTKVGPERMLKWIELRQLLPTSRQQPVFFQEGQCKQA